MKLQDVTLATVVGSICLTFVATVLLPAFGFKIDEVTRTYVFGLFASMASAGVAWIGANRAADAKVNTAMRMLTLQGGKE